MDMTGFLLQALHLRLDGNLSECPQPQHGPQSITITSQVVNCKNMSINSTIDRTVGDVSISCSM